MGIVSHGASRKHRPRRLALGFGLAALTVLGLITFSILAALSLGWWDPGIGIEEIENRILSWGPWAVAGSIGLMVLHSFVPFPAEFLAIANGMLFGPVWGTIITWSGGMLGAFTCFGLARALGRPFVELMVAQRNWQLIDEWTARRGGAIVLVSRLIPVIAFNLINYAAGLTRISWWTFAWTTGVGILPLTLLMVVMGDNIDTLGWESWVLLLICALVLWLVLRRKLAIGPDQGRVMADDKGKTP